MIARTYATPAGSFSALVDGDTVVAAGFEPPEQLLARCEPDRRDDPLTSAPVAWLDDAVAAYLRGDVGAFDDVPVRQPGTPLRARLWDSLRRVPAGRTVSYAGLAAAAGAPSAARAAGSACSTNHVALIVPCHRVVRADGSTGGYRYGAPIKEWLLAHERAHTARASA